MEASQGPGPSLDAVDPCNTRVLSLLRASAPRGIGCKFMDTFAGCLPIPVLPASAQDYPTSHSGLKPLRMEAAG